MYDEGLEPGVESNFFRSFLVILDTLSPVGHHGDVKPKLRKCPMHSSGVTEKPALYRFAMSVGRCHQVDEREW
jgi:hypothetical protein